MLDAAPTTTRADVAPAAVRRRDTVRFGLLLALFFGTGACGLVYQQLWLRELSLVFGVTVQAVSTVLAAFFGGLALGGYLAGRWSRRTRRPIMWYGLLEIGVGAMAVLTPFALDVAGDAYVAFATNISSSLPILTGVRFIVSFVVLIVPATLMGASLPLVVSSSMLRTGRLGGRVGLLYSVNTAGAVVGTVVAGFWLIGLWGLERTYLVAAAVNVCVGVVAVVAARRWDRVDESEHVDDAVTAESSAPAVELDDGRRRVVLITFATSGFVTLALEVVWFRQLILFLESSTYAFTVMLATVLIGIAVGSAIAAPCLRRGWVSLRALAAIEIALGIAALGSFYMLSKAYVVADRASGVLGTGSLTLVIVASGLAMLPATLLMGFAFPFGIELWVGRDRDRTGERVGTFYAVNVAAGIAGSLIAGFVLIPTIGTRPSLVLLSLAMVAMGIWIAWRALPPKRALAWSAGTAALTVLVGVAFVPDPYVSVMFHRFPGEQLVWMADDAQTTVSIQQAGEYRVMYVDGQHQANTTRDMVAYHRLLGALPVAVHPDPQRALVVGLGGGVSPGAMSEAPGLEVTVVELSPEVVSGAEFLDPANLGVTHKPNVSIHVDDGRNHLLVTDDRYDIITADVIPPHHAGAGKLWSVEYWELTRDALAPGGIMVQWVPQESDRDYRMILRSFQSVFPYATAWASGSMLIGSNEPLQLDRAALERKLADPNWRPVLEHAGVTSWDSFAAQFTGGPDEISEASADAPLLTDDRPRLEYYRTLPQDDTGWTGTALPVGPIDQVLP
jgi:spermidine synthase